VSVRLATYYHARALMYLRDWLRDRHAGGLRGRAVARQMVRRSAARVRFWRARLTGAARRENERA
jgi:hypothetical protein